MAFDVVVWSWVRATRALRAQLVWLLPATLLVVGCQAKIGGDVPSSAMTTNDAGVPVTPNQPCPAGQSLCGDRCVDTSTDAAHCGTCTNACGAGNVCEAGACHALCAQSETLCGTSCVSTQSDPSNCGTCGKACATGQFCSDGVCSATCAHQVCELPTGAQQCVDTNTHPDNCGGCGAQCAPGESCDAGVCKLDCQAGRTACGGVCVVVTTDSNNCGTCGTTCPAVPGCVNGSCGCPANQSLCSGACTDTMADSAHCGSCTTACSADMLCDQGVCKPKATGCTTGLTDCGGSCVDLQASASHCGACATVCPSAQSCTAGKCACPNAGTLCNGVCVDAQTSDVDCGTCGTACSGGQHCAAGTCACPAGQLSCTGACVDPMTSNDNCGMCGKACAGGQTCTAGACACPAGQTLCNGACVDTNTSNTNCGVCGKACTTGLSCSAGSCTSNSGADGCTGSALGISIQQIAAYQSVKVPLMTDGTAVLPAPPNTTATATQRKADVVVGRDTLFRVFVTTAAGFTPRQLSARLTLTNAGVGQQYFAKQTVSASSVEATVASTFMIFAPAAQILADTQYSVQLVECATGSGTAMAPQFPVTGSQPLQARNTTSSAGSGLKIKIIPVMANGMLPDTTETSLDVYRKLFMAMYPISAIDMSVGTQITANAATIDSALLDQIRAKRTADAPTSDVYYYGLMKSAATFAAFCGGSCTTGIGFVAGANTPGSRAAVGIGFADRPSAETMVHEVGHNHGRNHAPCVPAGGTISGVDAGYPYPGPMPPSGAGSGLIGSWGYDPRTSTLLDPSKTTDIMGYCNTKWISDYTYQGLVNRVATVNAAQDMVFDSALLATWRVLLLDPRGAHWGLPITKPSLPEGAPVLVRILDEIGRPITEVEAYRTEISDDVSAMLMVPEPQAGWAFVEAPGSAPLHF